MPNQYMVPVIPNLISTAAAYGYTPPQQLTDMTAVRDEISSYEVPAIDFSTLKPGAIADTLGTQLDAYYAASKIREEINDYELWMLAEFTSMLADGEADKILDGARSTFDAAVDVLTTARGYGISTDTSMVQLVEKGADAVTAWHDLNAAADTLQKIYQLANSLGSFDAYGPIRRTDLNAQCMAARIAKNPFAAAQGFGTGLPMPLLWLGAFQGGLRLGTVAEVRDLVDNITSR